MNSFTFNGHSTNEFGLLVTGLDTFGAPARRVEKIQVPGRSGDIIIDEGAYDNYIVRYTVAITSNFITKARSIAEWLLGTTGYQTLTDTYNSWTYRKACFYGNIDYVVTALAREGQASIEFDCKPQRYYLENTDITVNPTQTPTTMNFLHNAEPVIYMAQAGIFSLNGYTMTVTEAPIYINCQTMQSYYNGVLMNDKVTGDYPKVVKGTNNVFTNKTLVITPNYWEL